MNPRQFHIHQGGERGVLLRIIFAIVISNELKPMKISNHKKLKYDRKCLEYLRILLGIKRTGKKKFLGTGELDFFLVNKRTCTTPGGPSTPRAKREIWIIVPFDIVITPCLRWLRQHYEWQSKPFDESLFLRT